jgi:deazaflavin-dependent oxidoreductase (nitroreductase family)
MPPNPALLRFMSATHSFWYQVSGGIIGRSVFGAPVLLLTVTGRKSGRSHTTPLIYLQDGDAFVVVGSKGGSDQHPVWFLNLRANPDAEVLVGRARTRVRAEVANDEERARLWPLLVKLYKNYDEYQKGTERKIPVVVLRPVS